MRQFSSLLIAITALVWLSGADRLRAQDGPAGANAFRATVEPFLARHCLACHNNKLKTANLNFELYRDGGAAGKHPEVWSKVLAMLSAGKMPPPGMPAPDRSDAAAVSQWIESLLRDSGFRREEDPGRVTARRLNRAEYNNTVHELLGVQARPADDFPTDDSGYGFDNIGDVLSLSPMLMEKYLAAAKEISKLGVGGAVEGFKEPTLLARYMAKRSPGQAPAYANSRALPYSIRGALYGSHVFPADAEYEFRFRPVNYRTLQNSGSGLAGLEPPEDPREARRRARRLTQEEDRNEIEQARDKLAPVEVVLFVDGRRAASRVIEGIDNVDYHLGEVVARVRLSAGEHHFRASWPELANLADPTLNIRAVDERRKLFVDYLDIVGPFEPSAAPPESYRRVFVCGHEPGTHQAACDREIVENLARRAYRRPASAQEVDSLLGLVKLAQREGDSFEEGIRLAVQAVLVSPSFLFRIERDSNPHDPAAPHLVSEYELASRLSYFLWASMPDEPLFQAAARQKLRDAAVLEAQVRRMLADPRSKALIDNFAAQWLQLRQLARSSPDTKRFPAVDDELRDFMARETSLFLEAMIREDRSVLDFLDAPFTFVNGPLARHYGISGVDGEEFQRVSLEGTGRAGLLTQGSVLTVSSYATRTSPVLRGKWVLENLLGAPPPQPPDDVPELEESQIGESASLRQQLEQHRAAAACAVCHDQIDPIGFGLENYDAVGAWRTHDGKIPIDASGALPDGSSFNGAQELVAVLKGQSGAFTRNLSEKMLTYALGRGLETYDSAAVEQIRRNLAADGYRFSTLILETVKSTPFQMRRGDGGKP
jgi:mono/diheme cytochrome c family protein